MSDQATLEKVERENKKHLECPSCGHRDIITGAAVDNGDGTYTVWFGSEADFCTKCDEPWGRNV